MGYNNYKGEKNLTTNINNITSNNISEYNFIQYKSKSQSSQSGLMFIITNIGKNNFLNSIINNEQYNIEYCLGTENYLFLNNTITNLKNEIYCGNYGLTITKSAYNKIFFEITLDENFLTTNGIDPTVEIKEIGIKYNNELFIYGNVLNSSIKIQSAIIKINIYYEI